MRRYCFPILFIFLFGTLSKIPAQERLHYFFRHITQADGLLHNDVYSIAQDGKGFIWIATSNGLQRYDGSRFIYYPDILSHPAEGYTFSANIYVDKKKNLLWIIKNNVLEKMELNSKHLSICSPEKLLLDSPDIFDSYSGANNEHWLVNDKAVYYYDSTAKSNMPGTFTTSLSNANQSSYTANENGNTWLVSGSKLYLFDKKNRQVYSNKFNPLRHPLLQRTLNLTNNKNFRFIMIDSRQNIWITAWRDKFYKYDHKTKKIHKYSLSVIKTKEQGKPVSDAGLLVNCLLEDHNHNIWIGTENAGLLRYNEEKDNFDYNIIDEKSSGSLQYNYKIFSLFQDREDNIWVGTDKGISLFNPYMQYFKSIRHEENNYQTISKSEIINCIQSGDGNLYIGTWGHGVAVYDSNFNFKKNLQFKNSPEDNFAWSFAQPFKDVLWIGCQHGYLVIYNTRTGATRNVQPPEMEKSTIRCMEKDNKGNIWLGLHNGKIIKWDAQQHKFFSPANGLQSNGAVKNIFIDKAQDCWVSTETGFKKFDLEKRVYTNIWLPDKNSNSFSGITSEGIEEYNDSILLVGSIYGGLNFFNKITKTFSHLTTASGLPSNNVYAIKKDSAAYIWITSDYGLYKFHPTDKKFIPYALEPGIINSSFESQKFYPLQNGQWLTFTSTEVISFLPRDLQYKNTDKANIEITGFRIFDKPVSIDSLLYMDKPVRLSYKENFFTIEFASLNFSSLQQTNYYYRLEGIDKDWVNGETKRFANYTDLLPGKYTFSVKTETDAGTSQVTSFKIIISPPFWQTWWFIIAVLLCALFFIFLFIKWREKNIRAIEAEKLKVQRLNAEQYKGKLELVQIINYFSSSLIDKNTLDDILWDVAKNLIGRLGFVDCMIYLWNDDKTKMVQKAGLGPKGSIEEIYGQPFDVLPGQGVVGYVMQTKEAVLIPDTSKDSRYRRDEMKRLSEITVPLIYNNELIGVIDSEHHEKNFYTPQHLQVLSTIATLMANKIKSIEAEQLLRQTNIEMYSMNEQLLKAKLEALRAQMNPHFIFNCLTSIDNLIQMDEKERATLYLSRFARLIRSILENATNNVVPCWKDMETLQLYLELEELRWDKKFSYKVIIADEILNGDYKVPALVIQPFVENAIHHGLLNKIGGDKKLLIRVSVVNNHIHYVIEDNGVGRAKANSYKQLNTPSHQSMGMQITTDRINLFNQNKNGFVVITDMVNDLQEPCGTKVAIELINQS